MKGIQVCSNEGPRHFPSKDDEIAEICILKNPQNHIGPILSNLGTKHSWVKEIQVKSMHSNLKKFPILFQVRSKSLYK